MKNYNDIIVCECTDKDHSIILSVGDWGDEVNYDFEVSLLMSTHLGFWSRVKNALGFIFGKSRVGYCTVILDDDGIEKLEKFISEYKKVKNKE